MEYSMADYTNEAVNIINQYLAANGNLAAEATPMQSIIGNPMFMIVMMFLILYVLMIRPQQKQRKEHQRMLDALRVNDKVVTSSGIIGKITSLKNDKGTVIIRVCETTNAKIEFQKSSITALLEKDNTDVEAPRD
jgi:preprotein translocase subunit YajC